jgi:hypothetical protein
MNLAHQGDLLYVTWYTYDETGEAAWLATLASRTGQDTFAGDLVEVRGTPYDVLPYDPAQKEVTTVGTATLAFASPDAGTFSFDAKGVRRSIPITRFPLGGPAPACVYAPAPDFGAAANLQDLWWGGPTQDGWGINLAHEGDTIYATWYAFDRDGSSAWFAALLAPSAPGRYEGTLLRSTGPPFGPTFDPSRVTSTAVGTATLTVTNGNAVAWTYAIGDATGDKPMTRYLFVPPAGTLCR